MEPNALERAFARVDARIDYMLEDLGYQESLLRGLSAAKQVATNRKLSDALSKEIRHVTNNIHDLEVRILGFREGISFFDKYYSEEIDKDSEAKQATSGKSQGYVEKVAKQGGSRTEPDVDHGSNP